MAYISDIFVTSFCSQKCTTWMINFSFLFCKNWICSPKREIGRRGSVCPKIANTFLFSRTIYDFQKYLIVCTISLFSPNHAYFHALNTNLLYIYLTIFYNLFLSSLLIPICSLKYFYFWTFNFSFHIKRKAGLALWFPFL